MATRNRNRTQRKNKNRSRRNKNHRGGGNNYVNEGNNTERILAENPNDTPECAAAKTAARAKSGVMRKVGSIKVKQVCSGGAKTVAPNKRWSSGMSMRSRRNRKQGGGANNNVNEGNNTERILAENPNDTPECAAAKTAARAKSGVMRKVGSIKVKQVCSGGAKTVAPNKRWYNARAREGEQGVWRGSMSPTGSPVVPVKSCGNAGANPDGTCKVASQAQAYNYVA
jgi:hypothetical protein